VMTRNWDREVRIARKEILTSLSHHLERQATDTVDPPMVLTVLQDRQHLTLPTRTRYQALSAHSPLVAIFGRGLDDQPIPGVRGIALDDADPLCLEWTVVTLGARSAAALIAREIPAAQPGCADEDRLFEFVVTHDRPLVTAAARTLLDRIDGSSRSCEVLY
jgi:DICT domain-containing protein